MARTGHKRGSTKPANVKLRPSIPEEERAKPRLLKQGKNKAHSAPSKILRQEEPSSCSDNEGGDGDRWTDDEANGEKREEMNAEDKEERKPLQGMVVCFTGSDTQVPRSEARRIVHVLGGGFEAALRTDATFLIADKTEGDKYRAAVDHGIPVLHSRFLTVLHQEWTGGSMDIDVVTMANRLRLTPLHSLKICLTGFPETSTHSRDELRRRIVEHGGAAYSPALDSSVTHLVVGPLYERCDAALLEYGKVVAARQINSKRARSTLSYGSPADTSMSMSVSGSAGQYRPQGTIHVVWGEWLEHSLVAFGRQREEVYAIENVPDRAALRHISLTRTTDDITTRARESPRRKGQQGQLLRHETNLNLGFGTAGQEQADLGARALKRKMREDSIAEEGDDQIADGRAPETAAARRERSYDSLVMPSLVPTSASMSSSTVAKKARSSTRAELLGVQDLLAPSTSTSSAVPSQGPIFRNKGKKRMIPQDDDDEEELPSLASTASQALPAASAQSSASSRPSMLSKLASRSFKSSASSSARPSTSASASTSSFPTAVQRIKLEPQTTDISLSPAHISPSIPPPAKQKETISPHDNDDDADIELPPAPIFAGKTFYFVFPDVAAEVVRKRREAIMQMAGMVVENDGPEVDYVLCQCIRSALPEVNLGDPRLRTEMWLELCHAYDEIVPLDDERQFGFDITRPLRVPLPLPDAEKIFIAYAGFDEVRLKHLLRLCDALGVRHDPLMIRKTTTHLVIPHPNYISQKRLSAAQSWNVPVVFPVWLRELAERQNHATRPAAKAEASVASPACIGDDCEPFQPEMPKSVGPLNGCTICVSTKVERCAELRKLAVHLGADISYSINSDQKTTTHFVHQSKGRKLKETTKDLKLAQKHCQFVVHPKWLTACLESGRREPEIAYKHTLDTSRSLVLALDQQQSQQASAQADHDEPAPEKQATGTELEEDDEFILPPALKQQSLAAEVSMPSIRGPIRQSTPKTVRAPQPSSPTSPNRRSSSATLHSSPRMTSTRDTARNAASAPPQSPWLNDTTLIADEEPVCHSSSSSGKNKSISHMYKSSASTITSPKSRKLQRTDSDAENNAQRAFGQGILSSDNTSSDPVALQQQLHMPSNTAVTRDLVAEMNAIMESDLPQHLGARLPYKQNGFKRPIRRIPVRKDEGISSSPESNRPVSFLEAGLLARQQVGYDSLLESQLGGRFGFSETQDAVQEDQSMIIRINDPLAEATKAKLLAGIRNANAQLSSDDTALPEEESLTTTEGSQQQVSPKKNVRSNRITTGYSR